MLHRTVEFTVFARRRLDPVQIVVPLSGVSLTYAELRGEVQAPYYLRLQEAELDALLPLGTRFTLQCESTRDAVDTPVFPGVLVHRQPLLNRIELRFALPVNHDPEFLGFCQALL